MTMQEIDLSVYGAILWKRKFTILVGALVPAVVTAVVLLCLPPKRSIAYTYISPWRGAEYRLFEAYFYGTENLVKLAKVLRDGGFEDFASDMDEARQAEKTDRVKEVLLLDRFPGAKEREKEKEDVIQQIVLRIQLRSYKEPRALAASIRDYFEKSFPLYRLDQINADFLYQDRVKMLEIQTAKMAIKRTLQATQAQLDFMRKLEPTTATYPSAENLIPSIITGKKQFFPVEYQIRSIECEVAETRRKLQEAEMTEAFYAQSLQLGGECDTKIKELVTKSGEIGQFNEFLQDNLRQNKDLADVMSSRLVWTELNMLSKWRMPQEPSVRRTPKGTMLFSGLAFAVALPLMIGYVLIRQGKAA